MMDNTPELGKVTLTALDPQGRIVGSGRAVLPLLLGVGIFWPSSPLPIGKADRLALASGETLQVEQFILCEGLPVHYEFWVTSPFQKIS